MKSLFTKTAESIKYWWIYTVFGVTLMALGLYILLTPEQSFKAFGVVFSLTVLINGLFDIAFSILNRKLLKNWGWYLINGILKFSIGISLFLKPEITTELLPYFIGLYFMASAGSTIATALDLKSFYIPNWKSLLIFGLILFGLSILIMEEPKFAEGFVSIIIAIGFYTYGYIYILVSQKLKEVKRLSSYSINDLKKSFNIEYNNLKDRVIRNIKESNPEEIKTP